MPKIVDHAERRTTIARAAATEIARRGLSAVTLVGIGREAGVTTGAVSHYFANKNALIDAALRSVNDRMQARALEHDDPVAALLAVLPTDEESRVDWLVWALFADRASREPELLDVFRTLDDAWLTFVEQMLRDAGRPEPELDAAVLVSVVDGLGGRAATDPERWDRDRLEAVLRHHLQR